MRSRDSIDIVCGGYIESLAASLDGTSVFAAGLKVTERTEFLAEQAGAWNSMMIATRGNSL
jgi:hypothetical protein